MFMIAGTAALLSSAAFAQSESQTQPNQKNNMPSATPQNTQMQQNNKAQPQGAAQQGTSQQGQAGVRSVDPAGAVKLTFYAVQAADMRASRLMGADVYNLQNENIGEIQDLIIDNGKTIKAVVVSVGGFLGIGDRNVAVEPASIVLREQNDGSARVVINTNKEELKSAPPFKFADVDKAGSSGTTTGAGEETSKRPAGGDTRK
jgi:sporulation protein YlmC with PRC-barrel domain